MISVRRRRLPKLVLKCAAQSHEQDTAADSGQFGGHEAPMPDVPERPVAEEEVQRSRDHQELGQQLRKKFHRHSGRLPFLILARRPSPSGIVDLCLTSVDLRSGRGSQFTPQLGKDE